MTNDKDNICLTASELEVDIVEFLDRMDKGDESALNDLVAKIYLKAIEKGEFPSKLTDILIKYCEKNSSFLPYLTTSIESGNKYLADKLYEAGIIYWGKLDDEHAMDTLTSAYKYSDLGGRKWQNKHR